MAKVDTSGLRHGDRVWTIDGASAMVLSETQDGKWILVRYLSSPEDPSLVGTEDLVTASELKGA